MELSEEDKEAIENIDLLVHCLNYGEMKMTIASERQKEIAQELQMLLNVINNQQKEIEREEQYTDFYKDLCNKQQKIIKELQKDKKVLIKNYDRVLGTFISKNKIRQKIKEVQETMCPNCCACGLCDEFKELLEGK